MQLTARCQQQRSSMPAPGGGACRQRVSGGRGLLCSRYRCLSEPAAVGAGTPYLCSSQASCDALKALAQTEMFVLPQVLSPKLKAYLASVKARPSFGQASSLVGEIRPAEAHPTPPRGLPVAGDLADVLSAAGR